MRIVVVLVCLASFLFLVTCSSGPEPRRTGKGSYSGSSYSGTTERPRKYRRSAPTSARSDGFSTSGSRSGTSRVRGDYAGYASAERFVARMAREEGFDPRKVADLLSRAERKQWIIDLVTRPKSKRSTRPTGAWTRYRAKFLTSDNISNGVRFWRRYEGVLNRASRTYGVPQEYVVAIIGVETRYGGYMGKERIMDALVTLAFDFPRRSKFFTDELAAFLVMARDEGFDPFRPRGSYAGAMGYGQFMPSSFHKWAVDFDGDGRRDLWDPVDAIGSVANYFAAHGWRRGQPVITRARVSGAGIGGMKTGFDTNYSLGALRARGISPAGSVGGEDRVSLIKLDKKGGYQYWLGLDNFYVITRYNHSSYYAMAVHQLAGAVRARRGR